MELLWERLSQVKNFTCRAGTWTGAGTVDVIQEGASTLVFHEKGRWDQGIDFTNTLRWSLKSGTITLEHLRFGEDRPTFLVHFSLSGEALAPHHCGEDTYSARICLKKEQLILFWTVRGPKKNNEYRIIYT